MTTQLSSNSFDHGQAKYWEMSSNLFLRSTVVEFIKVDTILELIFFFFFNF